MRTLSHATLALFGLSFFLLVGCGGSGSGGGDVPPTVRPRTTLRGAYSILTVSGRTDPGTDARHTSVTWGTAACDGIDTLVTTSEGNRNTLAGSLPVDPDPTGPVTTELHYSETDTGAVTLLRESSSGDLPLIHGVVAPDGRYALLVQMTEGLPPALMVFVRLDEAHPGEAFAGTWNAAYLAVADDAEVHTTSAGSATAHETGVFEMTTWFINQQGSITSAPVRSNLTWTGTDAGEVRLSYGAGLPSYRGWGGSGVALLGGTLDQDVGPGLYVLTRGGASLSEASLDGEYAVAGFGFNPATSAYSCVEGTFRADGDGAFRMEGRANVEGSTGGAGPLITGRYGVHWTGALSASMGREGDYAGGVDPTGSFAVLTGGTSDESSPFLYILMRR